MANNKNMIYSMKLGQLIWNIPYLSLLKTIEIFSICCTDKLL